MSEIDLSKFSLEELQAALEKKKAEVKGIKTEHAKYNDAVGVNLLEYFPRPDKLPFLQRIPKSYQTIVEKELKGKTIPEKVKKLVLLIDHEPYTIERVKSMTLKGRTYEVEYIGPGEAKNSGLFEGVTISLMRQLDIPIFGV